MSRVIFLLVGLVVALAGPGCGGDSPPTTLAPSPPASTGSQQQKASDFAGRLQAAKELQSLERRNTAMSEVAKAAAAAGDGAVTQQAIHEIQNLELRNATASEAAVLLAKAQNSADAVVIAKMIQSLELRDQTLEKIATGK